MKTNIRQYLIERGVPTSSADELITLLPIKMPSSSCAFFFTAKYIMNPEKWFYWPEQTRFVLVGQCPNGDGIAIDTQVQPGAVYFISHELIGTDAILEDMSVLVAPSPANYAQRIEMGNDDLPMDFWEAKQKAEQGGPGYPPQGVGSPDP